MNCAAAEDNQMKKLLTMTLLALTLAPAISLAQQQFTSPELAASALVEAIGKHDEWHCP